MRQEALKVFISYSHKDKEFKEKLVKHLSSLIRQKYICLWYDNMIQPGEDLDESVLEALHSSQVMLLLVSANYLSSEYCYETELGEAMRMRKEQGMIVIPIMVRPVDVKGTLFDGIMSLPTDRKAITQFSNQDEAYEDIAKGIRRVVEGRVLSSLPRYQGIQNAAPHPNANIQNNNGINISGSIIYGGSFKINN